MASERNKGSGLSGAAIQRQADNLFMPVLPVPIDTDLALNTCRNPTSISGFSSNGRWLQGSDFSDGWGFSWYIATLYNHAATPNWKGWDCGFGSSIMDVPSEHAVMTARSFHPGGVNSLFGDGSVKFMKDSVSLLTWRALATRSGSEVVSQADY
jgi:prepilin-type processing-associated H-X9-DG protein